jgi:outer membrane protein assembly factor BamB
MLARTLAILILFSFFVGIASADTDQVRLEVVMARDAYETKGSVVIRGEVKNLHASRSVSDIRVSVDAESGLSFSPAEQFLDIPYNGKKSFSITVTGSVKVKTRLTVRASGENTDFYSISGDSASVYLYPPETKIKITDPPSELRLVVDEISPSMPAKFDAIVKNTGAENVEKVGISLSYDESSLSCSADSKKVNIQSGISASFSVSCNNASDGKRVRVTASDEYGVATDFREITFRFIERAKPPEAVIVGNVSEVGIGESIGAIELPPEPEFWPMFRGNIMRTGYSGKGGDMGGDHLVAWTYTAPNGIFGSLAVGDITGDGLPEVVVPVVKRDGETTDTLLVLNNKGERLWSFRTDLGIFSSPALGDLNKDGFLDIVFGTNCGRAYALSGRTNEVMWVIEHPMGLFRSSPLLFDLSGDGSLDVFMGSDKGLYAINGESGIVMWLYPTAAEVSSSPAIGNVDSDDNLEIVFASGDGVIYALDWNGELSWALETGSEIIYSSPAISADGRVMIGTSDGRLLIIKGGKIEKTYNTGSIIRGSPGLAEADFGGIIVFGTYREEELQGAYVKKPENKIHAIDMSGGLLWEKETDGWGVFSSPVLADIDRDGRLEVLIGTREGRLYALDLETGGEKWNYFGGSGMLASPAIADFDGDGNMGVLVAYRFSNQVKLLRSPDKADLLIDSIRFSDMFPKNNEFINVSVTVRNRGVRPAGSFNVSLYKRFGDFDYPAGKKSVAGLEPGESRELVFEWQTQISSDELGAYAIADADGEVIESDKTNNRFYSKFLNDLELIDYASPEGAAEMKSSKKLSVTARVLNRGRHDAKTDIAVFALREEEAFELARKSFDFGPDEEREIMLEFTYDPSQNYTALRIELDPDGTMQEINKSNNIAEWEIERLEEVIPAQPRKTVSSDEQDYLVQVILIAVVAVILWKKVISKKIRERRKKKPKEKEKVKEKEAEGSGEEDKAPEVETLEDRISEEVPMINIGNEQGADRELDELHKKKEDIEKMIEITKTKYYKRQINEETYIQLVKENQQNLIKIEAEIARRKGT